VRTTRLRRLVLPTALAVTVGLLAGCGGSAGSDPTSPSTSTSSEPSESPSESTAEESSSPAAAGADECLVGSWASDTDGLTRQMEKLMGDAVEGATVTATGDIVTTFDGTNLTASYEAFTVTFNVTESGMAMVMDLGFNGSGTTTYTVADNQLTLGTMDMSGVAITYTAKIGDETMDMSDQLGDSMDGLGTSAGTTSTYACDGSTLTITAGSDGAEMTQVYHRK
jgi:hypothetical protein